MGVSGPKGQKGELGSFSAQDEASHEQIHYISMFRGMINVFRVSVLWL